MAVLRMVVRVSVKLASDGVGPPCNDARVARALELMKTRMAERWTVARLARSVGASRAAFARCFLAEVGSPPLRHLTERRMERAAQLLAETDDKLASVAASVGYESEFAFNRAFRRHLGEAPGAFRRRLRALVAAPPSLRSVEAGLRPTTTRASTLAASLRAAA